ncbi:hypothetical protein GCM10007053_23380 [Halioglobus pacificus]|uniref:Uncharacterized protein n=1 Tax=Parahalioglobus pacificus TaxID=930806 RepID=A0A918XKC2_9GAMM|nr:hypothetical protein GCM10007053_23380 [Halioglobus pacificus]
MFCRRTSIRRVALSFYEHYSVYAAWVHSVETESMPKEDAVKATDREATPKGVVRQRLG